MSSTLLRRLLLTALVVASGCAALQQEADGWYSQPTHKPLPAVYREVDDVGARCGYYAGLATQGCAWRDYSTGLCFIFTAPNPPAWLKAHEEKHCAGYEHAAPRAMPVIAYRR